MVVLIVEFVAYFLAAFFIVGFADLLIRLINYRRQKDEWKYPLRQDEIIRVVGEWLYEAKLFKAIIAAILFVLVVWFLYSAAILLTNCGSNLLFCK